MTAAVMLHGWGTNPSVFNGLSDALRFRYVPIVQELPGYAGSSCEPYTLEQIAAEVARHAPERCSAIGWSLGAQIALAWARLRPRQVERLALLAATPCFVQREGWTCAMERELFDAFEESLTRDPGGTLSRFNALQAHGDVFAKRVLQRLRAISSSRPLPELQVLQDSLRILRETDLRDTLGVIRQPALVIHGARDRVVPLSAAEALTSALPDARLSVLSGAAHAPFISAPATVARLLVEFFDAR